MRGIGLSGDTSLIARGVALRSHSITYGVGGLLRWSPCHRVREARSSADNVIFSPMELTARDVEIVARLYASIVGFVGLCCLLHKRPVKRSDDLV